MTYVLGLTGSIGMGKSTTAGFFRDAGVPVWDADAVVHALYSKGCAGARAIEALAPASVKDGEVDRGELRAAILADPTLLERVEAAVHPLVAADREGFLKSHMQENLVLCDIPLLYETGAEAWLGGVLVVTADADIQRERVMARADMSEALFATILEKQMSDTEKRALADFIIDTGLGLDHARGAVHDLIKKIGDENA